MDKRKKEMNMKKINLAVVGATGMVGRTFLKVLEERQLPIENFYVMASSRSAGKTLAFNGKEYTVEELTEHSFDKPIDIALFSAGGSTSEKCAPIADGVTVFLSDTEHYFPDFMVVCDPDKIKRDGVHGAPDLVVEVLSKSTAKRDRWYKKRGYESAGVPEFWLVDPVHRSIEVYLLQEGRYVLDDVYTLFTQDDLDDMKPEERAAVVTEFKCHLFDDFVISLDEVFREWFQ